MKCVNNTTVYVSLKIPGSHSLSRIQGDDAIIDAFVNERLRQLLPSTNDCLLQFSENLPLESDSESLVAIEPKLYRFKVYLPHHIPRGQPISKVGGGLPPCLGWTSSPSHRLTLLF